MSISLDKNSGITATQLKISFYRKDKFNKPGRFIQRRFKDPVHFLHNLMELLACVPELVRVYFGKTISPGFREMIMLTVASTNDCKL
jgi:hypothetical protein